jgi:hypothetical protein
MPLSTLFSPLMTTAEAAFCLNVLTRFCSVSMRRELFGNLLVLTFVRPISSLNRVATNGTKQQLKIDITSDNICREQARFFLRLEMTVLLLSVALRWQTPLGEGAFAD